LGSLDVHSRDVENIVKRKKMPTAETQRTQRGKRDFLFFAERAKNEKGSALKAKSSAISASLR
jgi:hypothetical protein